MKCRAFSFPLYFQLLFGREQILPISSEIGVSVIPYARNNAEAHLCDALYGTENGDALRLLILKPEQLRVFLPTEPSAAALE